MGRSMFKRNPNIEYQVRITREGDDFLTREYITTVARVDYEQKERTEILHKRTDTKWGARSQARKAVRKDRKYKGANPKKVKEYTL